MLLVLAACTSESGVEPSQVGGAAGSGGPGGGTAGIPGTGAATSGGSGGAAGGQPSAGMAGGAGAAGTATGGVGGTAAGAGGSGGGGFWGPSGPKKQWECPPGPYPEQQLGQSTDICQGFNYNYSYNEGPTWIASQGAFFFTNFVSGQHTGGDIIKYVPGQQCEVWLHEVGCNGLGVSPSGNLLGACQGPRAVMEYDVVTKQGRMVATHVGDEMLDAVNDLIARSDGNVYFSNRTSDLGPRPVGLGEALVRLDPMGNTSMIEKGSLNGIALSPDETKLHVVKMGTFTLDAAGVPGQKGGPTPGGDGVAVDCAGTVTNMGTNSAYGGPDGKTLLIVGGGTQARTVTVTVPGLP